MAELLCFCYTVEKQRVIEAIEGGCRTVESIRDLTGATRGCGSCRLDCESLLNFYSRFPKRPDAGSLSTQSTQPFS